jgi:hypothetical protein
MIARGWPRVKSHAILVGMLAAVAFIIVVGLVVVLSRRRASSRVRISSCCGARPWPPDDLTADQRRAVKVPESVQTVEPSGPLR